MNLKYSPAGIGTFAGARFKLTKDDFLIGYADFNPILEKFIFVPVQFVALDAVYDNCLKQNLSDHDFDEAIARHERQVKAATFTDAELQEVKIFIRGIVNPEVQEATEKVITDKRSKQELERARDLLIVEIAGLTEIRDRLKREVNGI
jgi:hypothetical protein